MVFSLIFQANQGKVSYSIAKYRRTVDYQSSNTTMVSVNSIKLKSPMTNASADRWKTIQKNFIKKRRRNSLYSELKPEKTQLFGLTVTLGISYLMLIIIGYKYRLNQYQFAGLSMAILAILIFTSFCIILCSMKRLHHIRIKRRKSPLGNALFIPYAIEEHEDMPLASISAMLALRGSNAEKIISSMGHMCIAIGLIFLGLNIINGDSKDFYTNIMMIVGEIGIWLILTWQLEYTLFSDYLHHFGVTISTFVTGFAFIIKQEFSVLSVSLFCFAFLSGVVYFVVCSISFKKENIHFQSQILLLLEMIPFKIAVGFICVYVFNLSD